MDVDLLLPDVGNTNVVMAVERHAKRAYHLARRFRAEQLERLILFVEDENRSGDRIRNINPFLGIDRNPRCLLHADHVAGGVLVDQLLQPALLLRRLKVRVVRQIIDEFGSWAFTAAAATPG